jgi:hypothetical protein
MSAVIDYTKFDRLDVSDDEDNSFKSPSASELRYRQHEKNLKQKAAILRGEPFDDEEKGVDPSQRLTPSNNDNDESSSECDSDIEENPIFWKKLPKNWRENDTIRAMETLRDATPPEEMAAEMKDQGNLWYTRTIKEKVKGTQLLTYHRNALRCYTSGLNYAHSATATKETRLLHATLLVNRAAVQLARKNYRKTIRDCRGALRFDPNNIKGHYRAAQALYKLRRYDEAIVHVDSAVALDQSNKSILKCQKNIKKAIAARDARIAAEEAEIKKKRDAMDQLQSACELRNIRMGPALFTIDADKRNYRPQVYGDQLGSVGVMAWPIMLLYEEHAQNDFVQQFSDDALLRDLVDMVLPDSERPPWDEGHKYYASNIQLFFETKCVPAFPSNEPWPLEFSIQTEKQASSGNIREWVQIPLGLRLQDILSLPSYVIPHIVTFYVVPKTGSFHNEFMRRHEGHLRTLQLSGTSHAKSISSDEPSKRSKLSAVTETKVACNTSAQKDQNKKKKKKKKKKGPANSSVAEAVPADDLD